MGKHVIGAGTRSRTRDLLITSQRGHGLMLIYELSRTYATWGIALKIAFPGYH